MYIGKVLEAANIFQLASCKYLLWALLVSRLPPRGAGYFPTTPDRVSREIDCKKISFFWNICYLTYLFAPSIPKYSE